METIKQLAIFIAISNIIYFGLVWGFLCAIHSRLGKLIDKKKDNETN